MGRTPQCDVAHPKHVWMDPVIMAGPVLVVGLIVAVTHRARQR